MSGIIHVLPGDVVALIAAGEVVERPAAVIKELVENSLDADARAVTVAIREGGLDSIRVTDNGSGIAPEDLRLAFAQHATSKLRHAEDLHRVFTLGFRGEALASISRVSRVTLTSRQRASDAGMKVVNEGGEILSISESACAEGTQVLVRDLFFNAPVRRDFLKGSRREAAMCAELMAQLILSRPDVAFRLSVDGQQVYASPGDGTLSGAVLSVYGVDILKALKEVDGGGQGVLVRGMIGVGEQSRGTRTHQHFFLNGRAVRGQLLTRALEEACRHRVMIGRFPMCVLSLTLPYEMADVNVHPNKWEVRFLNEQAVAQALQQAVEDALREAPLDSPPPLLDSPEMTRPAEIRRVETVEEIPDQPFPRAMTVRDAAFEAETDWQPPLPIRQEKTEQLSAPSVPAPGEPLLVIGKAFSTYIIAQQGERLLLIDQHALHERLLFDRMMSVSGGSIPAQTLLEPALLEMDYPSYQAFLLCREDLARAGFDAEDFGSRSVRLLSVPLELGEPQADRAFLDALDELRSSGGLSGKSRRERIIMAACKHAVKGGEMLPEGALAALADEMVKSGVTPTCPHGRPILLELTRSELERRFGRIQK